MEPRGHGGDARTLKMWNSKTKLTFPVIWNYLFSFINWKFVWFFYGLCLCFVIKFYVICFFCLSLFYVSSSGCTTHILKMYPKGFNFLETVYVLFDTPFYQCTKVILKCKINKMLVYFFNTKSFESWKAFPYKSPPL